jgi:hypothetical protein
VNDRTSDALPSAATTDLLNRRARMSPAERDADIVKEVFGPLFDSMFGHIEKPVQPTDDLGPHASGEQA